MPSNPRKHKSRAILDYHTRRIAEQACEYVLETWELPRASGSQPKCGGHGGDDHACTPAPDLATAHVTGFVADEMRGPMESGAMADANTEGDSATGGAITRARCKYMRGDVRGKWLELRQRLQASGVDAPLPLEPSLTIPKSFLATMMVELPHLGEDVRKRGPAEYTDFAKSVPPQNPFMHAAAQDAEDSNASTHGRGTNQSNISQFNSRCSGSHVHQKINYHYHAAAPPAAAPPAATAPAAAPPAASAPAASAPTATAPAAAPAAAAPPSSEAQQLALREQLADMKAMFEQGLIPSREIYEDKVRQILGLE